MATQAIETGAQPYFTIIGGRGELDVRVAEGQTANIDGSVDAPMAAQEGNSYRIEGFRERLALELPADATLHVRDHQGAIAVRGIAHVVVETAFGNISIAEVDGSVTLRDLTGDCDVRDCEALVVKDGPQPLHNERRGVEHVTIQHVANIEIENVRRDVSIVGSQQVKVGNIGGACSIAEVAGDGRIANIGAGCVVRDIAGNIDMSTVGGDCTVEQVGGALRVGNIGGNATFNGVGAVADLGNVGGSLTLTSAQLRVPISESSFHIAVGGNAWVELPPEADLTIQAIVGGTLSGPGLTLSGPGMHRVVYGNGTAQLHLIAGGNIELYGSSAPQATGSAWSQWASFGAELGRAVGAVAHAVKSNHNERRPKEPASSAASLDEQRRAVLQKVAAGDISPDDADRMLAALEK